MTWDTVSFWVERDSWENAYQVVGAVGIDFDLSELASGDVVLEQDIEIGIGETLWLRKTEVSPDYTEKVLSNVSCGILVSRMKNLPSRPRRKQSCHASSRQSGS